MGGRRDADTLSVSGAETQPVSANLDHRSPRRLPSAASSQEAVKKSCSGLLKSKPCLLITGHDRSRVGFKACWPPTGRRTRHLSSQMNLFAACYISSMSKSYKFENSQSSFSFWSFSLNPQWEQNVVTERKRKSSKKHKVMHKHYWKGNIKTARGLFSTFK